MLNMHHSVDLVPIGSSALEVILTQEISLRSLLGKLNLLSSHTATYWAKLLYASLSALQEVLIDKSITVRQGG